MKTQVTYWLTRNPNASIFEYNGHPILCGGFVLSTLGRIPLHIKLTLSPFKREGYTRARVSPRHRDAEVTTGRWEYRYYSLYRALFETIRVHLPLTFWFKLEEWK